MRGRIDKLKEQHALESIGKAFDECAADLDYGKLSRRMAIFSSHYSDSIFKKLEIGRIKRRL